MADSGNPAVVDPSARAAETTTGVSVARSSTWNLAATVLPQAYLVAISIAAARFLGPDQFGRQSFIAFVELSLVMLLVAGLAMAVSRYVELLLRPSAAGPSPGSSVAAARSPGPRRRLSSQSWLSSASSVPARGRLDLRRHLRGHVRAPARA